MYAFIKDFSHLTRAVQIHYSLFGGCLFGHLSVIGTPVQRLQVRIQIHTHCLSLIKSDTYYWQGEVFTHYIVSPNMPGMQRSKASPLRRN